MITDQKQSSIVVLRDESNETESGTRPEDRSIEERLKFGVINVNKPQGPSSHQVSASVKTVLGLNKAGHSGTLDPNVTGCLVIALERASRVNQFLLKAGKEYVCLLKFHAEIEEDKAREVIGSFVGKIRQVPPVRSAVKRVLREREVYYIDIIEVKLPYVLFKVGCEAGTYIRTLCTGIGKKAGIAAHMQQLIRTKAGPFVEEESVSLIDLKDAYEDYKEGDDTKLKAMIHPPEKAVSFLKSIWVTDKAAGNIACGADLFSIGICKLESNIEKEDTVVVYSMKNELIAVGKAMASSSELEKMKKGLAVKTEKIFIEIGKYPR
jgi:H/ACA ribonucleoprotein complex subunit 4